MINPLRCVYRPRLLWLIAAWVFLGFPGVSRHASPIVNSLFGHIYSEVSAETVLLDALDVVVPDADEYFTDEWGQGKNFSSLCDFGFNRFVFDKLHTDGETALAHNPHAASAVLGLASIPEQGTPLGYREDCGRLALRYPIEAGKYSLLSYNAALSSVGGYRVFWSHTANGAGVVSPEVSDSYRIGDYSILRAANTFEVRSGDLNDLSANWFGEVKSFSLQVNSSLPQGGTLALDWVRLVDAQQSPVVTMSWSARDFPAHSAARVAIFADRDSQHYDGFAVARNLPLNGSFAVRTGLLPPGQYYFYAVAEEAIAGGARQIARSSYNASVRIDGKPSVRFVSPTRLSGVEYSRDERGDAWDMNQASDIWNFNLLPGYSQSLARGFHAPEIRNGVFTAVSDYDPMGAAKSVDTQVILATDPSRPIDPQYYRYFCYRLQLDTSGIDRSQNAAILSDVGYFSRLVYAHNGTQTFGSTGAFETIERSSVFLQGLNTYCIDLWDAGSIESGTPWLSAGAIDVMRFDPLESRFPTPFALDWAGLFGENHTVDGEYRIELDVTDVESDQLSVELYADTDAAGFDGVLLARKTAVPRGRLSFSWKDVNRDALPSASQFFLYAVVRDARNVTRRYSDVPLLVSGRRAPGTASRRRAKCDYDGDGRSEYTVVRPDFISGVGSWYLSSGALYHWGFVHSDLFIEGDFDGDLRSDVTAVRKDDAMTWFSIGSSNAQASHQQWGERGDIPMAMKKRASSRSQRVVFRPSNGVWYSLADDWSVGLQQWGLPGDVPLPADYDGDGDDDYAIWRPGPALWAILTGDGNERFVQWGLPGDIPFAGDYTGDEVADLVVWRPWNGSWYICRSETGFSCSDPLVIQFGLPGDIPVQGDWDGDAVLDVAVWRPSIGSWFIKHSSSGAVTARQWGLPGDFPLCSSMIFTRDFAR